jgi:hypothetical protein
VVIVASLVEQKLAYQNIEVIFHISFIWVQIRMHTENKLPRLPGSGDGGGGVTDNNTTWVELR